MDLMLPDNPEYCPPLSIKVMELKAFGGSSLFGNHTVTSVGDFEVDIDKELTAAEKETAIKKWQKVKSPEDSDEEQVDDEDDEDGEFVLPEFEKEEVKEIKEATIEEEE